MAGAGRTVLLVEDEVITGLAERANLEESGYRVIMARSGQAALDKALSDPSIDIVLMDLELGEGMDGAETARRILESRELPIIFVSGHTEPELVERTEPIGGYGFILKESGPTVLDTSIRMAFRLFDAKGVARESEERFRGVWEHMTEGAALHELILDNAGNAIDYRIIEVNEAFAAHLAIKRDQVVGKSSREAYKVERPPYLESYLRVALAGEALAFDTWFPAMGKWFTISAYRTGPGRFATIFEDITGRKRQEEALRESEERFRGIVEQTAAGYFQVDREGRFVDVNAAWLRLHGYGSRGEVVGRDYSITCVDEGLAAGGDFPGGLLEGKGEITGEFCRRRKDGSAGWHILSARQLRREGAVVGVEGFIIDTTETKLAELAMADGEGLYRSLFENMLDAFVYCRIIRDASGRAVDFVHLAVNTAFSTQTGLVDVVGRKASEVMPEIALSDPGFLENLGRIAGGGGSERFEVRLAALGRFFKVSAYAPSPEHVVAMFEDITAYKAIQAGLQDSEADLEAVLSAVADGILGVDGSGHVVYYNEKYAELWDLSPGLLEGGRDEELVSHISGQVADPEGFLARVEELYDSDQECQDILAMRDGRVIERRSMPFVREGRLSGRVWSFRDITERKKAEDRIERLLAEKELILREVHHRIKNNMNTINGFLALQADRANDPAAAQALLDAGSRVRGMMLLYDKLYTAKSFTVLPVAGYLTQLVDEVMTALPRRTEVGVLKEIDDFQMEVKRLQALGIVVNELLTNIVKYAFKGRASGKVSVRLSREGDEATLVVADDGVGLPDSVGIDSTAGFGLVLVGGMAEQLGGQVSIERGSGTRVVMRFQV